MFYLTRRTKVVLVACAACAFILFTYYHTSTPAEERGYRNRWSSPSHNERIKNDVKDVPEATSTSPPVPTSTALCLGDDCFRGAWAPRQTPYTNIVELRPWTGCPSPPPAAGARSEKDQAEADAKRLLDVMNWEWMPQNGVLQIFDADAFVVRLLRSPGGLIIVGDEMSDQYFSSLVVKLRRAGILMDLQDSSDIPYIHSYILNPDDARAGSLVTKANVSAARATRPVITLIEDAFLVSLEELKGIAKRVGAVPNYQNWVSPLPLAENWPAFVETAAAPHKGEAEALTEDTILLMNTGSTWSREFFTLLKPRNRPVDEQGRLTEAYRQMVRIVGKALQDIPQLSVYYRATTPGHPNCAARSSPYLNSKTAEAYERDVVGRLTKAVSSSDREVKLKWDWDLFAVHNDVWRRATSRFDSERETWEKDVKNGMLHPGPKKGKAKWRYLEVWNQTLQRPDAHYSPPTDCLNWCSPAIFDQWTTHLNHILQLEGPKPGTSAEKDD
ncbi:hypothetical protein DFP72DRAFT_189008 [Ephemerocybe angulata]|uniref:Uncharacterized protein n=1 Tax=Ephemerocybe angulata TaxID=980116 RepID=A0A8H6M7Z9_9AGAR|nr:hypothetical protein DFP72DRAFT_189008 [Tulosesus angulatus]